MGNRETYEKTQIAIAEEPLEEDHQLTLRDPIDEPPPPEKEEPKFRLLKKKKSGFDEELDHKYTLSEGNTEDVIKNMKKTKSAKLRPKFKKYKNPKVEMNIETTDKHCDSDEELNEDQSDSFEDQQITRKKKLSFVSKKKTLEETEQNQEDVKKFNSKKLSFSPKAPKTPKIESSGYKRDPISESEPHEEIKEVRKYNSKKNLFTPKTLKAESADGKLIEPEPRKFLEVNDDIKDMKKFNSKKNLFAPKALKGESIDSFPEPETQSPDEVKKFKKDFLFKPQNSVKSIKSQSKKSGFGFIKDEKPHIVEDFEVFNS